MNNFLKSKKMIYLFVLLFSILALNVLYIYLQFSKTKNGISKNQLQTNLQYIDTITSNLSQRILQSVENKSLLEALKESKSLRENLEKDLQLFRTKSYRYTYVVYKQKHTNTRT